MCALILRVYQLKNIKNTRVGLIRLSYFFVIIIIKMTRVKYVSRVNISSQEFIFFISIN